MMVGFEILIFLVVFLAIIVLHILGKINLKIAVGLLAVAFITLYSERIRSTIVYSEKRDKFNSNTEQIIVELNRKESTVIESIPKIIIQVWVQRNDDKGSNAVAQIPKSQIEYMRKMRQMNPDFQHMYFDGNDVQKFFESNYPEYYDTYRHLPAFIQKLDFFRYLAIYHYGGFYFDMDVEPHKPLDDSILNHHSVFPVDEYGDHVSCEMPRMEPTCKKGRPFLLGQYAFGSVANHPFLKFVVDKIRDNLESYIQTAKQLKNSDRDQAHNFVYKTTGPDFITDCYNVYNKPEQFFILSNGQRQVFGSYATHNYAGTWK